MSDRPFDYDLQHEDGLYVRCVCGWPWSAHDERGICPYNPELDHGATPRHYRPMIGKHGQSKNKPIQTYTEAFGHQYEYDEDGTAVGYWLDDMPALHADDEKKFKLEHTHTIARNVLNRIAAHGIRDFPNECCGFILGDKVEDVRPILNTNRYKGGSYTMDVRQQMSVLREVEQGKELKVVYHSHPNMGAFFSGIDRNAATSIDPEQPDWPDTVWIVMSIKSTRMKMLARLADARAYLWNPAIKDFSEITLKVEDDAREESRSE